MNILPPSRTLWATLIIAIIWNSMLNSQSLTSAQANALAAGSPFGNGINSLDWNPAGLSTINDWELGITSFHSLYGATNSLTLHTAFVGKRLPGNQFAAIQFSPGSTIEFDVPSTVRIGDSTSSLVSTYDKTITYSELYSLGYAYQFFQSLSIGLSAKFIQEKISDTKYSVDTNNVVNTSVISNTGNEWNINLGGMWNITPGWSVSLGVNNLLHISDHGIPSDEGIYSLNSPKTSFAGVGYSGLASMKFSLEADTKKRLRFGTEWAPSKLLEFRSGAYFNTENYSRTEALAFGLGSVYQFIHADLSYITFLDQTNRRGKVDINQFEQTGIDNIEFNPYTSDRLTLTLTVQLGNTRDALVHIDYVDIQKDIFPSARILYALQPIGNALVRNLSHKAIQVKTTFYVESLMDAPTQAQPVVIPPDSVVTVPLIAVFNDNIRNQNTLKIREGEVAVTTTSVDADDTYQSRILIHGKHDWNGDVSMLQYFITPSNPSVVTLTRNTLNQAKYYLDTVPGAMQLLEKAKLVFNEFISHVVYVNDPRLSEDYVQYPQETISLGGGDCDDITVTYSTLLQSIGISTAFVDVVPPQHTQDSHIYMMFDTGIKADLSHLVSDNPKRFIIRNNDEGTPTVWIPIETTIIRKGFEEAWRTGADEYYQDVEVNSGLVQRWVHIVDTKPVQ